MTDDVATARMSMVWPASLKERVRDRAGDRSITEFVVEAVELHLNGNAPEVLQVTSKEVNELKWLVQQLADRVAMGGDQDVRIQGLMELELPSWIDTKGWPKEAAQRVRPEVHKPEPESEVKIAEVVPPQTKPAAADTQPESALVAETREEIKAIGDDMLAKVMAMGREKGVELADIGLKPASDIPAPEKRIEESVEELEVQKVSETPQAGLCPTCKEELIEGECWTCD